MHGNHTIAVLLCLLFIFCIVFGYFLYRCIMRLVSAEVAIKQKLRDAQDVESGAPASTGTTSSSTSKTTTSKSSVHVAPTIRTIPTSPPQSMAQPPPPAPMGSLA